MQSFAWTDAMLCVGACKALRGQMQCFALRYAKLAQKSLVLFWIRELVLFWIREMEERLDIQVTVAPRKFLLNLNIINAREA
ncbi:hypothetical protein CIL02_09730 [Prevotella sp. P3-122]|nr:hypothetical protein CIL02_09730 [Prevotella sp. P3-122]